MFDASAGRVRDFIAILLNSNNNIATGNEVWVPGGLVGGYDRQESSYGIIAGSDADINKSSGSVITNNLIKGATEPVVLRSKTRSTVVNSNRLEANGNVAMYAGGIRDNGTGNVVGENITIDTGENVKRNAGSGKSSPISEAYTTATLPNATGDGTASNMAPMTVTLNEGGGLSSNGMFTAPVAGWYRLNVQCQLELPNSAAGGSVIAVAGCNPADGSGGTAFTYAISPQQGYTHMSGLFHVDKGKGLYAVALAAGTTKTVDVIGGAANSTRLTIALERPD